MSVEFEKFKEMREKPEEAAATMIEFTDEEGYGRFLDLHKLFEMFINIKGIPVSIFLPFHSCFISFLSDSPPSASEDGVKGLLLFEC